VNRPTDIPGRVQRRERCLRLISDPASSSKRRLRNGAISDRSTADRFERSKFLAGAIRDAQRFVEAEYPEWNSKEKMRAFQQAPNRQAVQASLRGTGIRAN